MAEGESLAAAQKRLAHMVLHSRMSSGSYVVKAVCMEFVWLVAEGLMGHTAMLSASAGMASIGYHRHFGAYPDSGMAGEAAQEEVHS